MARVKMCPVCNTANPPSEIFCQCGNSLSDISFTDSLAAFGGAASTPIETFLEPQTAAQQAVLKFPWGVQEVGMRLQIGREPEFSPIAARLCDYVSRRHAVIFWQEDGLYVRHLGRSNPTYVNGRPLAIGETTKLADGDSLGFSRHEMARLTMRDGP